MLLGHAVLLVLAHRGGGLIADNSIQFELLWEQLRSR